MSELQPIPMGTLLEHGLVLHSAAAFILLWRGSSLAVTVHLTGLSHFPLRAFSERATPLQRTDRQSSVEVIKWRGCH